MAEQTAAIGSKEWFNFQADKLIDIGLGVLKYKLEGGMTEPQGGSNSSNTLSTSGSGMMSMLPYILGGIAVIGIAVILIRR